MGRLGVSCVNIKITLTLLRVHYIATRWQSTHSKLAYCKCQSYNHSFILHYTKIYIFHESTSGQMCKVQLIVWSNPDACKDNCIPLRSCLKNNPPRNFPFGAEMCRRSKASKITTQRLDDLEVWGFWKWRGHSRHLIKYTPSLHKTGHLSTLSLLIIPTTSQKSVSGRKHFKGRNFFLKQHHHIFLIVNPISFAQEYLMLNC